MKKLSLFIFAAILSISANAQYQKLGYYKLVGSDWKWSSKSTPIQSLSDFKKNHALAKKSTTWLGADSTKYRPGFKYYCINTSYGYGIRTLIAYKKIYGSYMWLSVFKMSALNFSFEETTEDIWIESEMYRMNHVNDYTDSLNKAHGLISTVTTIKK